MLNLFRNNWDVKWNLKLALPLLFSFFIIHIFQYYINFECFFLVIKKFMKYIFLLDDPNSTCCPMPARLVTVKKSNFRLKGWEGKLP